VSLVETEVKDEDNPSAEAEEDLENNKDDLKNEQEVGNVEQDKLIRLLYNLGSSLAILVSPHSFLVIIFHLNSLTILINLHSFSFIIIHKLA